MVVAQSFERDVEAELLERDYAVDNDPGRAGDAEQPFSCTHTPGLVSFAPMSDVTRILSAIDEGDPHAAGQLLPLIYDELRRLAAERMAQEKSGQTLQPTALVHEAYVRLVDVNQVQKWNSRGHFFAAAAEAMRRILVEQARRKLRHKHGGGRPKVPLDPDLVAVDSPDEELLAINDALDKLAGEDPQAAQLVKLRYFSGLSVDHAAEAMGIPRSTAYVHWAFAKATLRVLLDSDALPT